MVADRRTGKVVESVRATPEHPFFTPKGMVAAGDLGIGTEIVTRAGPNLVVKAVQREHSAAGVRVYNLEVAGYQTYFVGKANGGLWVHNTCFANNRLAAEHYLKHVKGIVMRNGVFRGMKPGGADMPEFSSFNQYAKAADDFIGDARPRGVREAIRSDGDPVRFDERTGYFGIRTPAGVVRTFFRPDDGMEYYLQQIAR